MMSPRTAPRAPGGSVYVVPDNAAGDARVFGRFDSQRILGYPCSIVVDPLDDHDPQTADIFGRGGVFHRHGIAIHISGKDPFGKRTGPGFIRAIGAYAIDWLGRESPCAGLGCRHAETAAIVTWDGDITGRGHRDDRWQHHALWSDSRGYITLAGLLEWWRGDRERRTFTPRDVLAWIDNERGDAPGSTLSLTSPDGQHTRAVRRLLESSVGVSNNGLPATLRRMGRWSYCWEVA